MSVVGLPAARAVVLWRNTNRVFFANVVSLKIYVSGDESLVAARGRVGHMPRRANQPHDNMERRWRARDPIRPPEN